MISKRITASLITMLAVVAALASGVPVSAQASPVAPTACSLVRTGNTVSLEWTRAANDRAERFVIRRSRDGGTVYWAGKTEAPGTTFTQSGLSTSAGYVYWVETKSPAEVYSDRTECQSNNPGGGTPVPPASCSVVRTSNSVQVDWNRAADDNAQRFIARRARNGGTVYWAGSINAPTTTFTNSNLSSSSTYEYWVETVSANGTKSAPTPCQSDTPPPADPVAPLNCSITRTGNTVSLDWNRAANDSAERFVVRRSRDGGTVYWAGIALPPATSFSQSDLLTNSSYVYWVETKSPTGAFSSRTQCTTDGVNPGVGPFQKVIHISVDGLRPDHITPTFSPNLWAMYNNGPSTLNARSDYGITVTLPNHTGQLTSRRAFGPDGFNIAFNDDNGSTVHQNAGFYVESSFSVAHDNGLETYMLVGKDKFGLLERSWDGVNGAADVTGADNGRDKIDTFIYNSDITIQGDAIVDQIENGSADYIFWHIPTPDAFGHPHGWGSPQYIDAVGRADAAIGRLLAAINADPNLAATTAIIVTADHGGVGTQHFDNEEEQNYTIPFIVQAPGVPNAELYTLNIGTRENPGVGRPDEEGIQPIRGSEAGNLAMQLLGLNPIPGSRYNAAHDLRLS